MLTHTRRVSPCRVPELLILDSRICFAPPRYSRQVTNFRISLRRCFLSLMHNSSWTRLPVLRYHHPFFIGAACCFKVDVAVKRYNFSLRRIMLADGAEFSRNCSRWSDSGQIENRQLFVRVFYSNYRVGTWVEQGVAFYFIPLRTLNSFLLNNMLLHFHEASQSVEPHLAHSLNWATMSDLRSGV